MWIVRNYDKECVNNTVRGASMFLQQLFFLMITNPPEIALYCKCLNRTSPCTYKLHCRFTKTFNSFYIVCATYFYLISRPIHEIVLESSFQFSAN